MGGAYGLVKPGRGGYENHKSGTETSAKVQITPAQITDLRVIQNLLRRAIKIISGR